MSYTHISFRMYVLLLIYTMSTIRHSKFGTQVSEDMAQHEVPRSLILCRPLHGMDRSSTCKSTEVSGNI